MTSDLSLGQIAGLAVSALRHGMPEIEHGRIPTDGSWQYGGSRDQYIVFDTEQAADQLIDYIYHDVPLAS